MASNLAIEGYLLALSQYFSFDQKRGADAMQQKLQRRIANARGVAPDAALVSPTRTSVEGGDVHRADTLVTSTSDPRDSGTAVVQKRKYRRHPKVRCHQLIGYSKSAITTSFHWDD